MTKQEFIEFLKQKEINHIETETGIEVKGYLDLSSLTTLPEGVSLSSGGSLSLDSLTTLPKGVSLTAGYDLDLDSLTTLPKGVSLTAGYDLDLRSLTTLPEGVSLTARYNIDLGSLATLPEGVTLSAGHYLNLSSLTTLPEDVSFEKAKSIRLDSVTGKHRYQGSLLEFKTIDGMTMVILSSHSRDGILIEKARYFGGGAIDRLQACYIASADGLHAHGDSIAEAVSDLSFKRLQNSVDTSSVVEEIKSSGVITLPQFRILTGACKAGCRHFLDGRGISPETESLPIADVVEMTKGAFGGEKLRWIFSGAIGKDKS